MNDRRSTVFLPITISPAVLLGLYLGAYYATVEPIALNLGYIHREESVPFYRRLTADPRVAGDWNEWDSNERTRRRWNRFFAPAHWLDRHIRPRAWKLGEQQSRTISGTI